MTTRPSQRDGGMERPVHLSDEELSAYINGEIIESDALDWLTAHLDECARCRERLADTKTVVSLLNRAETPAPPRSFKLDPGMVRPVAVPSDTWIVRMQPVMRRLTAVAVVALVLIVAGDLLAHSGNGAGAPSTARDVTTSSQAGGASVAQSAATSASAGAGISAATATSAAALSAPAITERATPEAAVTGKQSSTAEQTTAPLVVAKPAPRAGPSYWRLTEFAVGVVVIWLFFLSVALPRLQRTRESR